MKNMGWSLFIALVVGDLVAIVMLKLGVGLNIVFTVGGLVFAIVAVLLVMSGLRSSRHKKREAESAAKIADLQDQMIADQRKHQQEATAIRQQSDTQ